MNLKQALLTNKKLTHNSPLRKLLYEYVPFCSSFNETVYCYLNNIYEIPKCPFSNNLQYFNKKYVGCSLPYYKYIKHDTHVKCLWLSWNNLFYKGLDLPTAEYLLKSKKLQKIRGLFKEVIEYNEEQISNILSSLGYQENVIQTLLKYDFTSITEIVSFIEYFLKLHSVKNNTIEYFLNKGFNNETSTKKLQNVFNTWIKFNKKVDKNSERYSKWLESRKPGLNKTRNSLRSKFEKKIYESLKSDYDIDLKFYTKINSEYFSKSKFKHDFFINKNLIVEYNGTYWHNDLFSDKRFNDISLYKLEIIRAKLSIELHNVKYLILWEADINGDMNKVKQLIDFALNNEDDFYSSREIDKIFYNEIFHERNI